jgi:hypothetical protein
MAKSADNTEHVQDEAQRRVRDAIDAREVADFTALPESGRRLSADFLQQLIGGADGELCCPVRIRGANIVGPLRPPSGSLARSRAAVQFWDCQFDSPVDFSGAEFLVLRFVNCTLPAFIGASLSVSADLDLSGSHFELRIRTERCRQLLDSSQARTHRWQARPVVDCDKSLRRNRHNPARWRADRWRRVVRRRHARWPRCAGAECAIGCRWQQR